MMLDILSLDGEAMPANTSSTTLVISIARLLLLQFDALWKGCGAVCSGWHELGNNNDAMMIMEKTQNKKRRRHLIINK